MAEAVMAMSVPRATRGSAGSGQESPAHTHSSRPGSSGNGEVLSAVSDPPRRIDPGLESALAIGGDHPLPESERAFFEPRFRYDFGNVRVHTDARTALSARSANALAYAAGRHIVFGHGQYAPGTATGRRLLAHELAHVLHQQPSEVGRRNSTARDPSDRVPSVTVGTPTPTIQRKLEMQGSKVEEFLQFLLNTTGRRFAYDPSTHLVGPPMRDPFESPFRRASANVAVDRLNQVIKDPVVTARVYIDVQGGFPRTVLVGQVTPEPGGWQHVDFSHIEGLERAVPGAGLAHAVHEIYERYRFEALPPEGRPGPDATHPAGPAHTEASRLEPLILRQFGLESGPRRGEDAQLIRRAGRQVLIFTIRYQRFDLIMRFRVDLAARPMQYLFDGAEVRRH